MWTGVVHNLQLTHAVAIAAHGHWCTLPSLIGGLVTKWHLFVTVGFFVFELQTQLFIA